MVLTTGAALGWSLLQPTRYEGVARVFLDETVGQTDDPGRVVRSQAEIISSPTVLDSAVELAGGGLTREELQERLTVEPSSDIDVVTVRALAATPSRAARVADSVVLAYDQKLADEVRTTALRTVDELRTAEQQLAAKLAATDAQLDIDPGNPVLQARERARSERLEALTQELEEADLTASSADQSGPTVERSVIPDVPAEPKPLLATALGGLVGFILAAALAWGKEGRRRVEQPHDAPATMREPARGRVAVDQGRGQGRPSGASAPSGRVAGLKNRLPSRRSRRHVRQTANGSEANGLSARIQQVVDSLEGTAGGPYQADAPQFIAEQVAALPEFDRVVVLLDEGHGLRVSGRVGQSEAAGSSRDHDRALIDRLVEAGPHLLADEDRARLVRAGLPGSDAETVAFVPLLHDEKACAVLLAGRRGERFPTVVPEGVDPEDADLEKVVARAQMLVPHLRAWLLLRRMTQRLATLEQSGEPGAPTRR